MAKFVTAKWVNREAVMARLNTVLPGIETEIAALQIKGAEDIATAAQNFAPHETGRYRASIHADLLAKNPGMGKRSVVAAQTKDKNATGLYANYIWRFLEFGTVHMTARPHMLPAYRAKRKAVRRAMHAAVNRAVRKAMKKASA